MRRFLGVVSVVLALVLAPACRSPKEADAQTVAETFLETLFGAPADAAVSTEGYADPCLSPGIAKTTAPVAIATATTTQIVALSAGKAIYVCAFALTITGTTPTSKFNTGTNASCAAGAADLAGAFNATINAGGYGTLITTPAGQPLCIVSTGTPAINGFVTYVQQ